MMQVVARFLVEGHAQGRSLFLTAPVSLWGGVDVQTGIIRDASHPQRGLSISDRIIAMTSGRGSSSSSSVVVEMVRLGSAPKAIILVEPDPILVMGALVANDLYASHLPVLQVAELDLMQMSNCDALQVKASFDKPLNAIIKSME